MGEARLIQTRMREQTDEFKVLQWSGVAEVPMETMMKALEVANMLADRLVAQEEEVERLRARSHELESDRDFLWGVLKRR